MPNAFTITLAGQDITRYVQWLDDPSPNPVSWPNAQPVKIDSTLGQGAGNSSGNSGRAATATFLTRLGPIGTAVGAGTGITQPALVRQGEVIITDSAGTIIFGGFAGQLHDATSRTQVATQVDCYDYWQSLSHITINEVFDGVSDLATIHSLVSKYAPWIDLSLLPAYPAGTLLGQVWRNKTLQWGLQKIADITGYQIYIDPYKRLIYNSPTLAFPAPFALSDTPNNSNSFPHLIESVDVDDTAIINRVTLYGGKQPTPDFVQDISSQANGNNTVFVCAYYMRKGSNGQVSVTVDGTEQVVGYSLGSGTKNTLKSKGGDCDLLLDPSARTVTFDVAPAVGSVVLITYRYQIPLVVQIGNQQSYSFYGSWFDGTISDETVVDTATAIRRCQVVLLEQAYGLTTIKLLCWKGGLQAGQQLQLSNTVRGLNNTYIIQEVTAKPVSPTTVQYEVTLGAWNWNLVDVLQSLAQRTSYSDTNLVETTTPIVVNIPHQAAGLLSVQVTPATHAMGSYAPGVTGTVPGGSSI